MALRSKLCGLVAALAFSYSPLAKAEEIKPKPVIEHVGNVQKKPELDLTLHNLPEKPKIDIKVDLKNLIKNY